MSGQTTIAAVSTPLAAGGIGIVRLSGDGAIETAGKIFRGKNGKSLAQAPSHTLLYGHVLDPETGEAVDEVLASVMRAPKSYTCEDMVEINCHGGVEVCRAILALCLRGGALLAAPGEFTKRAFLNGRIDLTQAEAVMDLISARSQTARRLAMGQLQGRMGRKITGVRSRLVRLAADILADVEYPEERLQGAAGETLQKELMESLGLLEELISSFEAGRAAKEGVAAAIAGRPNVGKSSFMNMISGADRSIVTEVPGTTRDLVEEQVRLGPVLLNIADTAGLRETDDRVERVGVDRAIGRIGGSELVFLILDGSEPLTEADFSAMALCEGKKTVAVINKGDLPGRIDQEYIASKYQHMVHVSALTGEGLDALEKEVAGLYPVLSLDPDGGEIMTSLRHAGSAKGAAQALRRALEALKDQFPPDIAAIDIEEAIGELGAVTGQTASEDIIADIFSRFCLGK